MMVAERKTLPHAPSAPRRPDALSSYLHQIENIPTLDADEEHELALLAEKGDKAALEKLVRHNLRFVVKIARQFARKNVPLEDLISEGNVGLVMAAQRFDASRGCRVITYANWWIRQSILSHLTDRSRLVRIPAEKVYDMIRMWKDRERLRQNLGRMPKPEELAKFMHTTPKRLETLAALPINSLSIDEPSENQDTVFEPETLQDPCARGGDAVLVELQRHHDVHESLAVLDPRERDIVLRHYGFGGQDPESLQRIGADYGITRERVRQLKDRALKKLRSSMMSEVLFEHVA